jgi:predicted nucleic acid-binding protein
MSWCFEDEAAPYTESVLDRLAGEEARVPAVWPLEVANVLLAAERRRRLTEAQSRRFVELLSTLPIHVDETTPARAMDGILSLAREQSLSAYDAAYLELAMREGLPIATRDLPLTEAARRCGVPLL